MKAGRLGVGATSAAREFDWPGHPAIWPGQDVTVRGLGLGGALLVDAGRRAGRLAEQAGVRFLEVEAIDDAARDFYRRHGALPLLDDEHHVVFDIRLFRGS